MPCLTNRPRAIWLAALVAVSTIAAPAAAGPGPEHARLTAMAGTFYTQYIYFIDPATAFSFNISIEAALVSIVGGIGTLWGPVVGTVLLETTSTLLQGWLGSSIGGVQLTVYSLILMAVILWRPTGLMGMISEAWQRFASRKPARATR